ncbi:YbaB/EbfC family nucleoid-associated protein [Mycoplasmopsis columbina]|uniref:YbaB/EbfC family nucleoid-associated protein n=1 Tax=Mycoplasmopsis columbina TaxID=114881 RepID=UPI0004A6E8EC|nr:YbaB/EbfC family nucleoid-associated protein [Mycoplasmopsis columbina]VEU76988.1 putative DNA repair-related protein [Mycoplasmopsis columbina]
MDQAMLRKMQKLQKEFEQKEEIFQEEEFKLEKQGVEVIAKGSKKIVSIKIKETFLLDEDDPETLEDLLTLVINDLFILIDEKHEEIMPNIPGLGF